MNEDFLELFKSGWDLHAAFFTIGFDYTKITPLQLSCLTRFQKALDEINRKGPEAFGYNAGING